mmetsp:Transcript_18672/g.59974  ORF Transcript_18672/g.59974 Transcript_18672/m.59974 type:complete len:286 (-) Transcript_18672:148-1005(-)
MAGRAGATRKAVYMKTDISQPHNFLLFMAIMGALSNKPRAREASGVRTSAKLSDCRWSEESALQATPRVLVPRRLDDARVGEQRRPKLGRQRLVARRESREQRGRGGAARRGAAAGGAGRSEVVAVPEEVGAAGGEGGVVDSQRLHLPDEPRTLGRGGGRRGRRGRRLARGGRGRGVSRLLRHLSHDVGGGGGRGSGGRGVGERRRHHAVDQLQVGGHHRQQQLVHCVRPELAQAEQSAEVGGEGPLSVLERVAVGLGESRLQVCEAVAVLRGDSVHHSGGDGAE